MAFASVSAACHIGGRRRRRAVEGPRREHLESRRRCPHLPHRREDHEVLLRQFGIERFGLGHVGHSEEGAPARAIRVRTTPSSTMARWGWYHLQGSRPHVLGPVCTVVRIGTFAPSDEERGTVAADRSGRPPDTAIASARTLRGEPFNPVDAGRILPAWLPSAPSLAACATFPTTSCPSSPGRSPMGNSSRPPKAKGTAR